MGAMINPNNIQPADKIYKNYNIYKIYKIYKMHLAKTMPGQTTTTH